MQHSRWAVDFYDSRAFDAEIRAAIRSNKRDVFLPASDGEMMASLMCAWSGMSDVRRNQLLGSKKEFAKFCEAIGYQNHARPRLLTVLRNRTIRDIVARFVTMQWGKQVFTLSAFEKATASRLNPVTALLNNPPASRI